MVLESSGTLTFLRLDKEPPLCQNGTTSFATAVSLSEVVERPADKAMDLSEASIGCARINGLVGLLVVEGHS